MRTRLMGHAPGESANGHAPPATVVRVDRASTRAPLRRGEAYTPEAFAAATGIDAWALVNLRAAGLPARQLPSGRLIILGSDAIDWLEALPFAPVPAPKKRRDTS